MSIVFEKLTPSQLAKNATVAQVLDNQWLPTPLFNKVFKGKKRFGEVDRSKHVLAEWRKSLIYSEQTIVNRAFFFNNLVLANDYNSSIVRKHFMKLINKKVVIPFLFAENSPDQPPSFSVNESLFSSWKELISDTNISCVKLHWGDSYEEMKRLSYDFHNYFISIGTLDRAQHLATSFGISTEERKEFFTLLRAIQNYAFQMEGEGRNLTRSHLYEKFINMDHTRVDEGVYDFQKSFSDKIKQIVDLKYNTTLPDALGKSIMTAAYSAKRTSLGEYAPPQNLSAVISAKTLSEIIRQLKTAIMPMSKLDIFDVQFDQLSLGQVTKIRDTEEWAGFRDKEKTLLSNPTNFNENAYHFLAKFEQLNHLIASFATSQGVTRAEAGVEFLLQIGTDILSFQFSPTSPKPKITCNLVDSVSKNEFTPLVLRLVILNNKSWVESEFSIDIINSFISNGKEIHNELKSMFRRENTTKKNLHIASQETNISHPTFLEF